MANRMGYGLVAATAALWGTSGVVASFAPEVPPITVGAASIGLGGAILALAAARRLPGVLRAGRIRLVVAGGLANAVFTLGFYTGNAWAGVALGTVLAVGSAPVFSALLEWTFERRSVSGRWRVAASITVVGGACLVLGRGGIADAPARPPAEVAIGVGCALLAGAAFALYTWSARTLMQPRHTDEPALDRRAVVATLQAFSAVPLLATAAITASTVAAHPSSIWVIGYLALVPTALGHLLFGFGLGAVRASTATVITLLEPVVAALLAVLVVGERLQPVGWLGLLGVLAGLTLLSWPVGDRSERRREPRALVDQAEVAVARADEA